MLRGGSRSVRNRNRGSFDVPGHDRLQGALGSSPNPRLVGGQVLQALLCSSFDALIASACTGSSATIRCHEFESMVACSNRPSRKRRRTDLHRERTGVLPDLSRRSSRIHRFHEVPGVGKFGGTVTLSARSASRNRRPYAAFPPSTTRRLPRNSCHLADGSTVVETLSAYDVGMRSLRMITASTPSR